MKISLLAIIIFLSAVTQVKAQDAYKGKFSKTKNFFESDRPIPVGTHKVYDEVENLSYRIKYDKNGLVRKIIINKDGSTIKQKFPAIINDIKWEEITTGLWINKLEEDNPKYTEFDTERVVKAHYAGYFLNGVPFDNSFIREKTMSGKLGYFVEGFSLGMTNLNKGEIRVLKIAPEMGYGSERASVIPANSTLIYYIYMIE